MDNKHILVYHRGTSVLEVVNEEMQGLVKAIEKSYLCPCELVFSSQRAIDKLKAKGQVVKEVKAASLQALSEGKEVLILPLQLMWHEESLGLKEWIRKQNMDQCLTLVPPLFEGLASLEPLLSLGAFEEVLALSDWGLQVVFPYQAISAVNENKIKAALKAVGYLGQVEVGPLMKLKADDSGVLFLSLVHTHHMKKEIKAHVAGGQGKRIKMPPLLEIEAVIQLYLKHIQAYI